MAITPADALHSYLIYFKVTDIIEGNFYVANNETLFLALVDNNKKVAESLHEKSG
jgi:hypothetical protein